MRVRSSLRSSLDVMVMLLDLRDSDGDSLRWRIAVDRRFFDVQGWNGGIVFVVLVNVGAFSVLSVLQSRFHDVPRRL